MCALEYVSPPDCVCDGAWVQGRVYGVGCRDVRGMVQGCIGYGLVTNLCFLHAELSNFYHLQVLDDDALQLLKIFTAQNIYTATNLCFLYAELNNFYHLQVLDDDALQLGLLFLLASCRHARSVRAYSHTP